MARPVLLPHLRLPLALIAAGLLATAVGASAAPAANLAGVLKNNYLTGLGDSNMIGMMGWASGLVDAVVIESNGALRLRNNAGVSGNTTKDIDARFPGAVLAQNPGILLLMTGTNDGTLDYLQQDLPLMVAQARAQGIVVVLCTIYPNGSGGAAGGGLTVNVNKWLRAFAKAKASDPGFVFADVNNALDDGKGGWADPADHSGVAEPGAAPNELHANPRGAAKAAEVVLRALAPLLATLTAPAPSLGDTTQPFANGQFAAATAVKGLAQGLGIYQPNGTTVASIVPPAPGENLPGNWQQLDVSAGSSVNVSYALPPGALARFAGKRVTFGVTVSTSSFNAKPGSSWSLGLTQGGGITNDTDLDNVELVQDVLIPPDATTTQLLLNIQGSGSTNPDGSHIYTTPGPVTFKFGNLFLLDAQDNYKVLGTSPNAAASTPPPAPPAAPAPPAPPAPMPPPAATTTPAPVPAAPATPAAPAPAPPAPPAPVTPAMDPGQD